MRDVTPALIFVLLLTGACVWVATVVLAAVAALNCTLDRLRLRLRRRRPVYAGFELAAGWPVVHRVCTGRCCRPHQPHEDHGDGTYTCHNCGHLAR